MHSKFQFLILSITILTLLAQSSSSSQQQIDGYIEYFQIRNEVQIMTQHAQNITFNSTKEKYLFIQNPLMIKCVQMIGEDFGPLFDSVAPGGIGAASYGIVVGTQLAVKAGLWKMGFMGLMKAAGSAVASASVLPVVIGVGGLAYLYNKSQQKQIKRKCRQVVKQINKLVTEKQLIELQIIKKTIYKELMEEQKKLIEITNTMKSINEKIKNYRILKETVGIREKIMKNYFRVFKKLTN